MGLRGSRGGGAQALASTLLAVLAMLAVSGPYFVMSPATATISNSDALLFHSLGFGAADRSALQVDATSSHPTDAPPSGVNFDYVLTVLLENKGICDILTSCGGSAPYLTTLAEDWSLATNYEKCGAPSLLNYLCLTGGSAFGCTTNAPPATNPCANATWPAENIVDRLESANLTWKAYLESMPSDCFASNSGTYAVKHNPFVYYGDIATNATRCARVVPSGTSNDVLLADLNSTANASNYMWLTPNLCNDMHDCTVAEGDAFMASLVPQILNSTVFRTQRAVLLIAFDEDSGGKGSPNMYTVWAGTTVKREYSSHAAYHHFSTLRTIETNWNLPPLTANDSAASDMSEFFGGPPSARFTFSPVWPQGNATITFDASTSSTPHANATLQYRWDWTNNGTWDTPWSTSATDSHAFEAVGTYTVLLQVEDSLGGVDNRTRDVIVDDAPPVTSAAVSGPLGLNGWYVGDASVTLNATDDRSGIAGTDYRLDAGPWQTYASPVLLTADGSHSLDFFSTDRAGHSEATNTLAIARDGAPPVTSRTLSGILNGSTFVSPILVTLDAVDATSGVSLTQYNVDDLGWTNYTAAFTVDNTGSHIVRYDSIDLAGNVEPENAFTIDNGTIGDFLGLSSQASFQGTIGSANWFTSSVNVTLELVNGTSPPDSIWYCLDAGPWTLYGSPFLIEGDGIHTLDFNATNGAGLNEIMHHEVISIDTTPPSIAAVLNGTPGQNGWYVSTVTVTLTASDLTSGVSGIAFRIDSGTWVAYVSPFVVSDGVHTVDYYATDVAGNIEPGISKIILIDLTAPSSSASWTGTLGNDGWYVSIVSVVLVAADATSGVASISYRLDNGSWNTYTGMFLLPEGRHFLEYHATDVAGLEDAVASATLSIDTTAPRTTAALTGTPGFDGWYTSTVEITLSGTDATSGIAGIRYRVDGGGWQVYTGRFLLGEGAHVVGYYGIDSAGLSGAVGSVSILIDTTPPASEATIAGTPGNDGWYVSAVTVTLHATDSLSGAAITQYRLDGGPWQRYEGPISIPNGGRHVLDFASIDAAGNQEAIQSLSVEIERSMPYFVSLTAPAQATTSPVQISWSAADNDSAISGYALSVDGAPFTSLGIETSISLDLSVGLHVIRVRATDVAGHATVRTLSIQVLPSGLPLSSSYLMIAVGLGVAGTALAYLFWRKRNHLKS